MMNRCGSCIHWNKQKGYDGGQCRLSPPKFFIEHGDINDGSQAHTLSEYPYLNKDYPACGQFKKKAVCMRDRGSDEYILDGIKPKEIYP